MEVLEIVNCIPNKLTNLLIQSIHLFIAVKKISRFIGPLGNLKPHQCSKSQGTIFQDEHIMDWRRANPINHFNPLVHGRVKIIIYVLNSNLPDTASGTSNVRKGGFDDQSDHPDQLITHDQLNTYERALTINQFSERTSEQLSNARMSIPTSDDDDQSESLCQLITQD